LTNNKTRLHDLEMVVGPYLTQHTALMKYQTFADFMSGRKTPVRGIATKFANGFKQYVQLEASLASLPTDATDAMDSLPTDAMDGAMSVDGSEQEQFMEV
jgi:hypothetical protein